MIKIDDLTPMSLDVPDPGRFVLAYDDKLKRYAVCYIQTEFGYKLSTRPGCWRFYATHWIYIEPPTP